MDGTEEKTQAKRIEEKKAGTQTTQHDGKEKAKPIWLNENWISTMLPVYSVREYLKINKASI